MDLNWSAFNSSVQLLSAHEFFFLSQGNAPAHTAASVCEALTSEKCYKPSSTPVHFRFISARLFPLPQVQNEVIRTPIFGCCWDPRSCKWWSKEDPKRGHFGSISETVRPRKNLYIYKNILYWINKILCVLFKCLRFFK
jgi:hypothetical protein